MTDRARSTFMSLKSKRQRIEDDEDDFHFVNKRFKRDGDLDNIQTWVTALVAILDSKNERKPKAKDKLRDTRNLHSWWDIWGYNFDSYKFEAKLNFPWLAARFNNLPTGYWLYLFHLIRFVWCVCVCCW